MLKTPASPIRFPRLLLTGAGGNLGKELRPRLKAYCDVLRVSHRRELDPAVAGEEVQLASLEDKDQMMALLQGVNAVVHMGGVSTEQPWAPILAGNIVGMVNLYEAIIWSLSSRDASCTSSPATAGSSSRRWLTRSTSQ